MFRTKVNWAAFYSYISPFIILAKNILAWNPCVKCCQNEALLSISSTFYSIIFCTKWIEQLSIVTFQLFNFWRKNIGAKWVCKMLIKLTPVLPLTNRITRELTIKTTRNVISWRFCFQNDIKYDDVTRICS